MNYKGLVDVLTEGKNLGKIHESLRIMECFLNQRRDALKERIGKLNETDKRQLKWMLRNLPDYKHLKAVLKGRP